MLDTSPGADYCRVMLSDDVFRTQLRTTIAALEGWLAGLSAVATVEISADEASWRTRLQPHMREACPFELVLRTDQLMDVSIGRETYEDIEVKSLDAVAPLLVAIVDGHVITSTWKAAATGLPTRVSTIISPPSGPAWTGTRHIEPAARSHISTNDSLIRLDRHYVPYARGA